jgi:hypothetical protein
MGERRVYRAGPASKKRLLTGTTNEKREIDMPRQKNFKYFWPEP